jgi:hypothetical protein
MPADIVNIKTLENFLLSVVMKKDSHKELPTLTKENILKTDNVLQIEKNKIDIAHIMVERFFMHNMKSFLLSNEQASYFTEIKYSDYLPEWAKKNILNNKSVYSFHQENISDELKENIENIRDFLFQTAENYIDKRIKWFNASDKKDRNIKINLDCLKTFNEYSDLSSLIDAMKKGDLYRKKQEEKSKKEQEFLCESMRDTQTMMEFDDGIKIVNLKSNLALYFESREMRHCIGDGEYDRNEQLQNIQLYSLRDKKGHSHVTLEVRDGKLCQCKGHNNQKPSEEYLPYVRQFIISQNFDISGDIKQLGIFKQDGRYYDLYNLPKGFVYKGTLDLSGMKLTKLPDLSEIEVTGSFICRDNSLTSLIGSPKIVRGSFFCNSNKLTDLIGAPEYVGENFYCTYNKLTTLVGATQNIGGSFVCLGNKIKTLKGAPQKVGKNFDCSYNLLKNLEYLPEEIGGKIICHHNLFIIQDNKVYDLNNLPEGFVIKGDLDLSGMGLSKLPDLSKITVEGNFNCSDNNLTSLDGLPKFIGGDFDFSQNKIGKVGKNINNVKGSVIYNGNPFVRFEIEKKKLLYRKNLALINVMEEQSKQKIFASGYIREKREEFIRSLTPTSISEILPKAAKVEKEHILRGAKVVRDILREAGVVDDKKRKRRKQQKIRRVQKDISR